MSDRKLSPYATKRKKRLVPLQFSDPCNELCAALRDVRVGPVRLNTLRDAHDRYLGRERERYRAAQLPAEWAVLPPLGNQLR